MQTPQSSHYKLYPYFFLFQAPESITDVLHVLRGQCDQSCVACAQVHELEGWGGERTQEKNNTTKNVVVKANE